MRLWALWGFVWLGGAGIAAAAEPPRKLKVHVSVDMEGVAGVVSGDQLGPTEFEYQRFREFMTKEAVAAVRAAQESGATEIVVADSHGNGQNLLIEQFPKDVRIVRSWPRPLGMMGGIDKSFDAAMFVGYHSKAGDETNPLAHTLNLDIMRMRLNGMPTSEFLLHAYAAAYVGVPVVFVSGDKQLCADIKGHNPRITTVALSEGKGPSTISIAPRLACERIRKGVEQALNGDLKKSLLKLPKRFTLEIEFSNPVKAYKSSWYPGCKHIGGRTIRFETRDYFEVLRALKFVA